MRGCKVRPRSLAGGSHKECHQRPAPHQRSRARKQRFENPRHHTTPGEGVSAKGACSSVSRGTQLGSNSWLVYQEGWWYSSL